MLSPIAHILKSRLEAFQWMERFGGLVIPAVKPEFVTGLDGQQTVKSYQVYPVACEVNMENCWENGQFRHFEPDARKSAIAFFTDNGGCVLRGVEGPKDAHLKFSFDLKFLCWVNSARLGDDITGGGCQPSGRLAPYVFGELFGEHSPAGLFAGGIEEMIYQAVEVTGIRELPKSPAMFEPFTFAREGLNRNLFIYPYDYFGLAVTGTFVINKNCLPDFGEDWQPFTGCLAPPGDVNWFNRKAVLYLASLPEFNSNEDALSGTLPNGDPTDALVAGDPYWGAEGHVSGSDAFYRVV